MPTILAADIGGANSRFAVFDSSDGRALVLRQSVWLKTGEARSFEELLQALEGCCLPAGPLTCDIAVLAVPGPPEAGVRARLANVAWEIDVSALRSRRGDDRVVLINDFAAQAFACRTEAWADALLIQKGQADPDGALAVIGAGTGLGHCALLPVRRKDRTEYLAVSSEAGHAAFAFVGPDERAYEAFLLARTGAAYAVGDTVVSGAGLAQLHAYLSGEDLPPWEVAAALGPASETTRWFARFYGRACRNYVLAVLARGGLFLAGGVAAKNPWLVDNAVFRDEFATSRPFGELLQSIPILLNRNEESGLWGAAYHGLARLRSA